jgi:uncharacterized protein YdaU (DUF1376 family)
MRIIEMSKKQPKYVSLEPDAFLSDLDFQAMTAEQRGVYCTLIFYLYRNNGRLRNDIDTLAKLCHVNGDFDFQTVLHKFQVRRGFIRHKRVTKELARAQVQVDKAVKAARTRWDKESTSNAQALDEQCQAKERNGTRSEGKLNTSNTNSKERARSLSSSVRFVDELEKCLNICTKSDRTAIGNLCRWLMTEIAENRRTDGVYSQILAIARESRTARKPIAAFFSRLDRELGYRARAEKEKRLAQGN